MKRISKIFIVLLILNMIGMCGCNMGNDSTKKETEQEVINAMNEHLTSKYGEVSYEKEGFIQKGWDHDYDLLNAKTTGKQQNTKYFEVRRYTTEQGYEFKDTYFEVLISDEIDEKIKGIASQFFEKYELYMAAFCPTDGYSNKMTSDKTFEDALNEGEYDNSTAMIKLAVVQTNDMTEEKFKEQADAFIAKCGELNAKVTYQIYFLGEEVYQELGENDVNWDQVIYNDEKYITKISITK